MSLNGSEQLEKAMEEVLDDEDEVKVEKSSVEKMEKHVEPKLPGMNCEMSHTQSLYLCLKLRKISFVVPSAHCAISSSSNQCISVQKPI